MELMKLCVRNGNITPLDYWEMTRAETLLYLDMTREARYDRLEDEAIIAIMQRNAQTKQRVKAKDLFERPKPSVQKVVSIEEKRSTLDALDDALGFG